MIKIGTCDENPGFQPIDLQSSISGPLRTLIVPKELETEFILQCEEGEVLDPIKVIEMYLAQRKYELMETMFARKKTRLEAEFYPDLEDFRWPRKKRGHQQAKAMAKHVMQTTVKMKSVYCHSVPDEDAFGKLIRHGANLRPRHRGQHLVERLIRRPRQGL